MTEASDELNRLLESLGINYGDPILRDEYDSRKSSREFEAKEDEEWCDSITSDDIDVLKDYGTTPPRTERNRKQKERNAYCSHAVAAAKSFCSRNKHRLAARCASLPLTPSLINGSLISETAIDRIQASRKTFRQRKRSQDIQRSYERHCKLTVEEIPNDLIPSTMATVDDEDEDTSKCESLPPMFAVKVPTRSRYMSVFGRKVGNKDWMTSPRKISTLGLPPDRVSFHAHMVGLLKNNSQEHAFHLQSQRSEEEVLYQQELHEMIWFELQAWHAGQDTLTYDNFLLEQREKVLSVYEEVMNFNGNQLTEDEEKCEPSKGPTLKEKKYHHIESTSPNTNLFWNECCDDCLGCLSVWCYKCREKENKVLEGVWNLLEKVDYVQSLFPSSRKLGQSFPCWNEKEFIVRYKALCLWFNVTSQLRFIIDLLGRRLGHMTKDLIPWPVFSELKTVTGDGSPAQSVNSRDSGSHSWEDSSENEGILKTSSSDTKIPVEKTDTTRKTHTPVVRFEIEADDSVESSDLNQSTDSNEVNYVSNDFLYPPPTYGLRRCSSDIFLEANPYRTYVGKLLRNKGMKKTLDKVAEVIRDVMSRTVCIIEESYSLSEDKESLKVDNEYARLNPNPLIAFQEELKRHPHSNWMGEFRSIGLPYFHTLFLFLASLPLHMMRECLKLRLEQMPMKPSRMSIKQLMSEYKEGIKFAVAVRHRFEKWCRFLLVDLPPTMANNLETRKTQAIEELDSNVKKMLEVYLEWLDQFILMLHRETHVAGLQRNFLQEEWCFIQATCPHVTDGESLAATRFCNIACHMLCSVRDFLDTGLDDMISDLQASALDGIDDIDSDDAFEMDNDDEDEFDEEDEGEPNYLRKKLVVRCRSLQELIGEARERALRAIALAKMLKMDLEVAIEGKSLPEDEDALFIALQDSGHALVKGHSLRNLLIFVPENLMKYPEDILSILQMRMGESSDKYLILLNAPLNTEEKWSGKSIELTLNADCAIALSRVQVCGLMIIVKDGNRLQTIRRTLSDAFKDVVTFSNDQIAPHKAVTQSLLDMKAEALQLCKGLEKSISDMEDLVSITKSSMSNNVNEEYKQISHLIRDTLHQGFLFGFEYHKEALRLVSGRQRAELSPLLIHLGCRWMKFVRAYYSSGKGNRPRWALPGFEFLLLVCDPNNTSKIPDAEFKTLRTEIEECREYIIGSVSNTESSTPSTPLLMGRSFKSQTSSSPASYTSQADSPSVYADSPKFIRHPLVRSCQPSFDKIDDADSTLRENPIECIRESVEVLDRHLEEQRFKDKLIGRVIESHNRDLVEIKPHNVSFSWHRGFKIGAGHFGKVYTAVNNNSGELMAMKVLPLQPHDLRSIKKVANELKTFERINHPSLVKYYGIEIHNDEMLMFMEYCDEGTIEALAASTEGLPEEIVRKYTRQLLSAVHTMHENGIVHRDIKGANIFLAKEGNLLKLGDFGCAVRIRGLQTEVNELSGIVGTHAYMAPEIFRSNEGHGRAADIWSVGCVVIEMLTGKRPWPQYDSSVQIMFQVGCGSSPASPDKISEEGDDFLRRCFVHSPKDRATAAMLLDHTFVKVEEEENMSLPLFSWNPMAQARRSRLSSGDIRNS